MQRIEKHLDIRSIVKNALDFKILKNVLLNRRERLLFKLQRLRVIEAEDTSECEQNQMTDDTLSSDNSSKKSKDLKTYIEETLKSLFNYLKNDSVFKE